MTCLLRGSFARRVSVPWRFGLQTVRHISSSPPEVKATTETQDVKAMDTLLKAVRRSTYHQSSCRVYLQSFPQERGRILLTASR